VKRLVDILAFLLSIMLTVALVQPMAAQERISVQGQVMNKDDANKLVTDAVTIYGYNTYAEAMDAYRSYVNMQKNHVDFNSGFCIEATFDRGVYEFRSLPADGAILFTYYSNEVDPIVERINGRHQIDCYFSLAQLLDEAKVTAASGPLLEIEPPEITGNKLPIVFSWPFPKEDRLARPDARFALQTFVIDSNEKDTLEFKRAIVMDGVEYHETQIRRMGYVSSRDPLLKIAEQSPVLTNDIDRVYVNDSLFLDPPSKRVFVKAKIWCEDYNVVYLQDSLQIYDTRRVRRPMRFLEYDLESSALNPTDPEYVRRARPESMSDKSKLDINFLVGQAKVDPKDSSSLAQLEVLKHTISNILSDPDATLREYTINGVASPEGNYAKNVALANARMSYIASAVNSVIPSFTQARMIKSTHSRVAGWDEVADLLYADSLKTEAEKLREIVNNYPKSMDQQGAKIRMLPFYKDEVVPRLPKLRSVEFNYSYELFRELTPDEVVDRFYNDPSFKEGGKRQFTPYDYWVLLQRVKESDKLEEVCRRAISLAQKQGDEWPLPYNILAMSYIARDHVDTTLLAPFVEEWRGRSNYRLTNFGGTSYSTKNPDPVVANQVVMMLKGEHYQRAVEIATRLLPKDSHKYQELEAIARCLAGYFKGGSPEAQKTYQLLHESTPRNAVVMDMAMRYMALVPEELEVLPEEDPVSHYLRAQSVCLRASLKGIDYAFLEDKERVDATRSLVKCFQMDPKYIEIANSDWDIYEGMFKDAKEEYDKPGSVLPPERPVVPEAEKKVLTEEEKKALIMKSANHPEEMTDEEWILLEEISAY